ncbi:MAG: hypothetical protein MUO67_01445 [Anaerolineales bacterium]|nr:hypothetical protein [Anaerolineales bacterium]
MELLRVPPVPPFVASPRILFLSFLAACTVCSTRRSAGAVAKQKTQKTLLAARFSPAALPEEHPASLLTAQSKPVSCCSLLS